MCQMHWEQRANVQLSLPGLRRSERGTSVGVEPPCPARVNEAAGAPSPIELHFLLPPISCAYSILSYLTFLYTLLLIISSPA